MAPFDSLRDYAEALEKRGKFIRIKEMDQDKYEATAFYYKLMDRYKTNAPGFLIERMKINGKWYETPVVGNIFCGFDTVAQCFGVENISDNQAEMYTACRRKRSRAIWLMAGGKPLTRSWWIERTLPARK